MFGKLFFKIVFENKKQKTISKAFGQLLSKQFSLMKKNKIVWHFNIFFLSIFGFF
jgi:hypothetical protein